MKVLNLNKAGVEFYRSAEGDCVDCGEALDYQSPAYVYMRRGEPVFKCQSCIECPEESLEKILSELTY